MKHEEEENAPARRRSYRETRIDPSNLPSKKPAMAQLACLVGGVVGALLWGAVTHFSGYEVGYVAWAVGGLVGGACVWAGGRGAQMAVTSAVFAVVSICAGKYLSIYWLVSGWAREDAQAEHDFLQAWAALGESPSDAQIENFLIAHEYGDTSAAEFREEVAPGLSELAANPQSIDELAAARMDQFDIFELLVSDFNAFDLLWIALGVATAYQLVMKASQLDVVRMQQAHRAAGDDGEDAGPNG